MHRHFSGHRARARRGTALLLVLWLVVLLASVTMAASGAARSSGALVTSRRAQATARAMAESGVNATVVAIDDALRRLLSDSLARDLYLNGLDAGTNNGESALGPSATDSIDDGAFAVAVVDVSARLDVNSAGEVGLATLLRAFGSGVDVAPLARRIAARVRGEDQPADSVRTAQLTRDSLVRSLLGADDAPSVLHPFESLDELTEVPGLDATLLARVAPFLTVDGIASVNRQRAPAIVVAAATGSLIDAPARLLIVSRGWQLGHVLSHEIQAVYDVSPNGLRLVRWRERTL
ncbi:MAG: general secretion pathway protein GspK [Phycisphaerae bacterium]|nr:general secretion pathway protein GspK [Gemmatimonadaceae bacterium]